MRPSEWDRWAEATKQAADTVDAERRDRGQTGDWTPADFRRAQTLRAQLLILPAVDQTTDPA